MIGVARLDGRHHHRHLWRVVDSLAIESHKRAALADLFVHVHISVDEVSQVPDHDALGFHTGVFEKIELFER